MGKSLTDKHELERTAHHEAAHAVIAFDLDILFLHCSIVPGEMHGTLGNVPVQETYFPRDASDSEVKELAENHAVIDYAGCAAEVVLCGWGDMSDKSCMANGA